MSIKDDINRIAEPTPTPKSLGGAVLPSAIRSKTGLEPKKAATLATEEVTVQSTDGLFTFVVLVVKV